MKKKVALFFVVGCLVFGESSNGNCGKDKIGLYLGYPVGLSYSHEFNDLIELDMLIGYGWWAYYSRLDIQVGALFTVFDPVISGLGGSKCPLSVGPVLGGSFWFGSTYSSGFIGGSIKILAPLRWELNFGNVPDLNLFIEAAPLGLSINFIRSYNSEDGSDTKVSYRPSVGYAARFGLGIRYRIPAKK